MIRYMASALFAFSIAAAHAQTAPDISPHKIQFITVDKDVKLEVLDWGGSGRAIVMLTGMGDTAHVFDEFAPKLTIAGHVYGITRRGFGASSNPSPPGLVVTRGSDNNYEVARRDPSEVNAYDADRLGDDVLAVMDQLKLERPVLIGHSIGGEELSSIGSRHPEKVAGLVYIDALQPYAFFKGPEEEMLFKGQHAWPVGPKPPPDIQLAVLFGGRKYTNLPVPVLALAPFPRTPPAGAKTDPAIEAQHEKATAMEGAQLDSLEHDIPTAHIVRVPYADHYLWRTNEADAVREIKDFVGKLR
jgi:pimeloyl-ACP methyl ester carboxylesterase